MSIRSSLEGVGSTIFSNLFIKLPVPTGDLRNQVVIVTGSNQGLGYEASRHILRLGAAKLVMGVRNMAKGEAARAELLKAYPRADIEVWHVDMEVCDTVKAFAARAALSLPRLDVLLANAGISTTKFSFAGGNEKTLTVNVVSTFLLCLLLLPKLRETAQQYGVTPRITIPNSALHYMAPLKELEDEEGGSGAGRSIFARLSDPDTANMTARYPLSKLLVVFGVRAIAERISTDAKEKKGGSAKPLVVINTPNPSFCKSQLEREVAGVGLKVFEALVARTTEVGGRALVDGVLAGPESHGQYLTNCHVHVPSRIVTNAKGVHIQQKFFEELMQELEKISPGISSNL